MRDDPTVVALVTRATAGDQGAWHEIVERYAPLVWSICVRYQLNGQHAEDVGQTVWLLLVEQLGKLRDAGRAARLAGGHHRARVPAGGQGGRPDRGPGRQPG